jgi:hypothetical protein
MQCISDPQDCVSETAVDDHIRSNLCAIIQRGYNASKAIAYLLTLAQGNAHRHALSEDEGATLCLHALESIVAKLFLPEQKIVPNLVALSTVLGTAIKMIRKVHCRAPLPANPLDVHTSEGRVKPDILATLTDTYRIGLFRLSRLLFPFYISDGALPFTATWRSHIAGLLATPTPL